MLLKERTFVIFLIVLEDLKHDLQILNMETETGLKLI